MPKRRYFYGPLPKREGTIKLEQLVKKILTAPSLLAFDSMYSIHSTKLRDYTLTFMDETYMLTDLFDNADYEHFHLDQEDIERYNQFLNSTKLVYPSKLDDSRIEKMRLDRTLSNDLLHLANGSVRSLNIYTNGAYTWINRLFSGNFYEFESCSQRTLVECFLAGMVIIAAINQSPSKGTKKTSRVLKLTRGECNPIFYSDIESICPTLEVGKPFIKNYKQIVSFSKSFEVAEVYSFNPPAGKQIFIKNKANWHGLDISSISQFTDEEEVIKAPSKTELICKKVTNKSIFFKAKSLGILGVEEEEAEEEATKGCTIS